VKKKSKSKRGGSAVPLGQPPVAVDIKPLPKTPVRFYSKQDVLAIVGISASTLWEWIKRGEFPAARVLGQHGGHSTTVRWLASEVDEWCVNRPRRFPKGAQR
jgi:predicted DNA-binding transcriptional regulator AlpA